jgi:hypothetical protein
MATASGVKYLQSIETPPSRPRPWTLVRLGPLDMAFLAGGGSIWLLSHLQVAGCLETGDRNVFKEPLIRVCRNYAIPTPWRASWAEGDASSLLARGHLALRCVQKAEGSSNFTGSYACRGSTNPYAMCCADCFKVLWSVPGDE